MDPNRPSNKPIRAKMLLLPAQHPPQPSLAPPFTTLTSTEQPPPPPREFPRSPKVPKTDAERWLAVTSRNPEYANAFIYAVMTTRIYCRPNCPSRLARRANIEFFSNPREAVAAGYRACKRCKPDQGDDVEDDGVEKVRKAVEIIKQRAKTGEKISLSELSKEVGLSKWHLQRAFKKRIGLSPREMGERIEKEKQEEEECKGKQLGSMDEGGLSFGGGGATEGEMLFAFTPGSSDGLTDSSKFSDDVVSSLPTPLTLPFDMDMATELELMDKQWLTGFPADETLVVPPFNEDLNFANFDPHVESVIRDLFPEIYADEEERMQTELS